jgi:endonuclease YncB( thermonuclease family)
MLKYLVAALLVSSAAFGQEIKGKAIALDGGTLLVTQNGGGKAVTVKIWGIDAPDMKIWPWGPRARGTLDLFLRSHERGVICERRGNAGNQIVGKCRMIADSGDNDLDVGKIMIRSGYAVEDRKIGKGAYQEAEETAWRNNLGVWTKFWAK